MPLPPDIYTSWKQRSAEHMRDRSLTVNRPSGIILASLRGSFCRGDRGTTFSNLRPNGFFSAKDIAQPALSVRGDG